MSNERLTNDPFRFRLRDEEQAPAGLVEDDETRVSRGQVHHPRHYQVRPRVVREAADVVEMFELPWHLGDAFKYMARAGKKPGAEEVKDLEKARWYIDRRVRLLRGELDDEGRVVELERELSDLKSRAGKWGITSDQ